MLRFLVVPLLLLISFKLSAQVSPKEGGKLNYRIVGFSFPAKQYVKEYEVDIAKGYYTDEAVFSKRIIRSFTSDTNRLIAEVPFFGKQYTWQVLYKLHGSTTIKSKLFHFGTLAVPEVDSSLVRLRILKQTNRYADNYVFLDANKVLYDMQGQPVWFLPHIKGLNMETAEPRDLKCSPFGTITFLLGSRIYEIDYEGNVIWAGPDNDLTNNDLTNNDLTNNDLTDKHKNRSGNQYHHEFTRLANGHYMVLGNERLLCRSLSSDDSCLHCLENAKIVPSNASNYVELPFETLIEYDQKGHKIWAWHESDYFNKSDLFYYSIANGRFNTKLHSNAFFFDEQKNEIYISFRDISRVIKIKYPEGSVLSTYGEKFSPGIEERENPLFCLQHACRVSQQGFLYLFNNGCDADFPPKIIMMRQSALSGDSLSKVWEYVCLVDDYGLKPQGGELRPGGGNVIELFDSSIFVAMGMDYSKVFIVNLNKEILWSAISEKWNATGQKWEMMPSYRASIFTRRKQLEDLIWQRKNAK